MNKIESLAKDLVELRDSLDAFKAANSSVFQEYQDREARINELTEEIKSESRQKGIDTETDRVRISVSRAFKSWYDASRLSQKAITALKKNDGLKTEVVKAVFDDLLKLGKIDESDKAAAFQEEEMQPRVLIKFKEPTV